MEKLTQEINEQLEKSEVDKELKYRIYRDVARLEEIFKHLSEILGKDLECIVTDGKPLFVVDGKEMGVEGLKELLGIA